VNKTKTFTLSQFIAYFDSQFCCKYSNGICQAGSPYDVNILVLTCLHSFRQRYE